VLLFPLKDYIVQRRKEKAATQAEQHA